MAFGDIDADEEGYGIGFGGPNMSGYGYSNSPRKGIDDPVTAPTPFNVGSNPFGIATEEGQPVTWGSALTASLLAPSMVNAYLDGPVLNDPDEMGPWSGFVHGVLSNPGQAVVDSLQNKAASAVLGVPGLVIGGLRTGYDALTSKQNPAPVESINIGTNLGGGSGFAPSGMGMGGGPDAAQMSPNAFGMADPLGLDNALATNLYSFPKQYGAYQVEDFNPNLQFNTHIPNPEIENMYNDPDAANRAIDIQLEAMGLGPLSSTEFGPVMDSDLSGVEGLMEAGGFLGGGGGMIAPDMEAVSRAGGEPLAQRIAETMIAQQAARAPSNNVTIPMSSGPDIVIDVTPPAPQAKVAPQRRAAPRPSPVKIAAKSVAKPKAFKALPKFAQKEIRQGRVPTSGSDNVQDMVRAFLATPEPATPRGQRPPGATR